METTILQENLHKALSFVGKNVTTKTQLPVLSNILIETDKGRLKLSSTNLESSISFWIGADTSIEGAITVPARLFGELVAGFSHEKISIITEQAQMKLICADSEATLAGIDASEFPPLPEVGDKKDAEFKKELLEKSLPFVLISASSDEGRPVLTGIRFVEKDGKMLMVATDGFRLSVKAMPSVAGLKEGLIIPARALSDIFRAASEEKSETVDLFLSRDQNQIVFSLPNLQIATRLIEGQYPPYERIIPASFTTRTIIGKDDFLRAVKLASVYARESANIVKLKIENSTATVTANSPQVGENKTTIEVRTEGEGGEIAINSRFLLDVLNVFPEDEVVFEMTGPLAPAVFKTVSDDSYLHIIMPVRVQG